MVGGTEGCLGTGGIGPAPPILPGGTLASVAEGDLGFAEPSAFHGGGLFDGKGGAFSPRAHARMMAPWRSAT